MGDAKDLGLDPREERAKAMWNVVREDSAKHGTTYVCGSCGYSWFDKEDAERCCASPKTGPMQAAPSTPDTRQIGGSHYASKSVQPWEAMEAWMPRDQFIGFLRGNAIKYLSRAGDKGEAAEDYAKAHHYLDKLLAVMEGKP